MRKPTLSSLRTTYRVLQHIDYDVPQGLLVKLADMIRKEEKCRMTNKIARMSEEDLIRLQGKVCRRIRIDLPDGRIIHQKTNEATFIEAIQEAGPERIAQLSISIKEHPLIVILDAKRKMLVGYKSLSNGCFLYGKVKAAERISILQLIDSQLQLNWDIQLI